MTLSDSSKFPDGQQCADMCLDWPIGSLFESYPWQIHNSPMDVPWSFFAICDNDMSFWVHSISCSKTVYKENATCLLCNRGTSSSCLLEVQAHARNKADLCIPHIYLNNLQLQDLVNSKPEQLNKAKLKVSFCTSSHITSCLQEDSIPHPGECPVGCR